MKITQADFEKLVESTATKIVENLKPTYQKAVEDGLVDPTKNTMKSDAEKKNFYVKFLKAAIKGDMNELAELKVMTSSGADAIMLPQEFEAGIIIQANQNGKARQLADYQRVIAQTNNAVVEGAAASASYVDENTAYTTISDSDPVEKPLTLKSLVSIVAMTNEASLFARENPEAYLAKIVAKAMTDQEDTQYFNGTGSPFTGIMNVAMPAAQKINLAAAGANTIAVADLLAVMGALPEGYEENAVWTMSKQFFFAVIMALKEATTNAPIFNVIRENGKPVYTLLGSPVVFSGKLATSTTSGDDLPVLAYGDFKEGTRFYERQGIEMEVSNSAVIGAYNAFTQRGKAMRFVDYNAVGVADNRTYVRLHTLNS